MMVSGFTLWTNIFLLKLLTRIQRCVAIVRAVQLTTSSLTARLGDKPSVTQQNTAGPAILIDVWHVLYRKANIWLIIVWKKLLYAGKLLQYCMFEALSLSLSLRRKILLYVCSSLSLSQRKKRQVTKFYIAMLYNKSNQQLHNITDNFNSGVESD